MLAARLFALEESILSKCDSNEQSRFRIVVYFFMALMGVGFVSFYYFFFLLFDNFFYALIGSTLLEYVFYSVLRFSIISISVPIDQEISLKGMIFNFGNFFRVVLFSAFVFTMLVPFFALVNHKEFSKKLNNYKEEIYSDYISDQKKAKGTQLAIIQKKIDENYQDRKIYVRTLKNENNYVDHNIATFQIARIDSTISILESRLIRKGNIISELNLKKSERFYSKLNADDMPFFRFRLVFSKREIILLFLPFFLLFFSIVPQYFFALGLKKSKYDNIYSKQMTQLILKDFHNMKKDCIDNFELKYPNRVNELRLFKESPFDTTPEKHNAGVRTDLDLFSYFQGIKKEQNINHL